MTLVLPPQLEQAVRRQLESGRYQDETDVLGQAIRLLEERDLADRLRTSMAEADAQIERGLGIDWSPELMDRLRSEAQENARQGKEIDEDVWP